MLNWSWALLPGQISTVHLRIRAGSSPFDTHEVLVLQLLGKKRWQVFEPITRLPLEYVPPLSFEDDLDEVKRSRGGRKAGQDDIDASELGPLALEASLEPGDCLYLPRGFVHQAEAMEEPSVHISLGVHVITWLDLLSVVLGQVAYRDERLRQAPASWVAAQTPKPANSLKKISLNVLRH